MEWAVKDGRTAAVSEDENMALFEPTCAISALRFDLVRSALPGIFF